MFIVTEEASRYYKNEWWNFEGAFKGLSLSTVLKDEMQIFMWKLSNRKLEFFWMVPIGDCMGHFRWKAMLLNRVRPTRIERAELITILDNTFHGTPLDMIEMFRKKRAQQKKKSRNKCKKWKNTQKNYWRTKEKTIPVHTNMSNNTFILAMSRQLEAFSHRS